MGRGARVGGLVWILVVGFSFVGSADAGKTIDVGDRRQLFIDNMFFESSENVALHIHPAAKTGERTLESDRAWENATLNWFSVLEDAGVYRMWYECYDVEGWPTPDDTSFCYAESKDGIHWNKPALGLFTYHGSTDNNILFRQVGPEGAHSRVHGAGVFVDPKAPPEARYKAVAQGQFAASVPPYRVAGMYSADGLRWTRFARPICDVFADSQYSGFWDPGLGQFVMYGRVNGKGRALGRTASSSFERFESFTLVLQNEGDDAANNDLYNPAAVAYPYADKVYLMFPSVYRHSSDTLDIHLAVSRDGVHWTWPEHGKPFVALGPADKFDSGSLYMGQGLVRVGSEIFQYYSGSPLKHNEAELDALAKDRNKRVFSRIVSRLDGFVSVDAGAQEGSFVTPPLTFRGNSLHLNLKIDAGGKLRVGVVDADGHAIAGRAVEDCTPITGDTLDAVVAWKDGHDLAALQNKPVKLVVKLENASLFAFQFSPAPASTK